MFAPQQGINRGWTAPQNRLISLTDMPSSASSIMIRRIFIDSMFISPHVSCYFITSFLPLQLF